MNENIDLTKILKDCPRGTRLYSPALGFCFFGGIIDIYEEPEIGVKTEEANATWDAKAAQNIFTFSKEGYLFIRGERECLLFPSKDQRDWGKWECPKPKNPKFNPETLNTFDKVLGLTMNSDIWRIGFFSHKKNDYPYYNIMDGSIFHIILPFNDETKHLVGTTDEAPEYYRYWED